MGDGVQATGVAGDAESDDAHGEMHDAAWTIDAMGEVDSMEEVGDMEADAWTADAVWDGMYLDFLGCMGT